MAGRPKKDETKYTYRLLRGMHVDEKGGIHKVGALIKTDMQLDRLLGRDKFQRVAMSPKEAAADPFDEMTLPQLRAYAEDEEIELGGARTRADVLAILRNVTPIAD